MQTKIQKRKGAIHRLERYIKQMEGATSEGALEAQAKRKEHLSYLKTIEERR